MPKSANVSMGGKRISTSSSQPRSSLIPPGGARGTEKGYAGKIPLPPSMNARPPGRSSA
jgi:hypothetical protein